MNAVIRAAVLSATDRGWHVLGVKKGYAGLLGDDEVIRLTRDEVRGIGHLGGTILRTTNRGNPFSYPVLQPDGSLMEVDRSDELLDNARNLLEGDTFVVVNGKLITDLDLKAALDTHRQRKALATLVLLRNPKHERFSIVETRDGLVSKFGGMPAPSAPDAETPLMFTGIHILESRIFEYIPRGVFSHSVTDVYLPAMARGERIAASSCACSPSFISSA